MTTTPSCCLCGGPLDELLDGPSTNSATLFPDADAERPVEPPAPAELTPEQLGRLISTAPVIESWLAAVRAEALQRAQRGVEIPGYKLVQKLGNRKWIDDDKAVAMLRRFGIDPLEHTLISPAQAERKSKVCPEAVDRLTVRPVIGALVPTDCPAVDVTPALKVLTEHEVQS